MLQGRGIPVKWRQSGKVVTYWGRKGRIWVDLRKVGIDFRIVTV